MKENTTDYCRDSLFLLHILGTALAAVGRWIVGLRPQSGK